MPPLDQRNPRISLPTTHLVSDAARLSLTLEDCTFANHLPTILAKKGYEIGTAANLEIGDVFEFLWADSNEFEWEWKCLGYIRFIVLRHSETFPHHAVCM